MAQRHCPETLLRVLLDPPGHIQEDAAPGRFLVKTPWEGRRWHVILEPDHHEHRIVVVTVYQVEDP